MVDGWVVGETVSHAASEGGEDGWEEDSLFGQAGATRGACSPLGRFLRGPLEGAGGMASSIEPPLASATSGWVVASTAAANAAVAALRATPNTSFASS